MYYLDFLRALHQRLDPPTYLEIGIRHGSSLAIARAPSIGIDPSFRLETEVPASAALFEETSDEYFARAEPLAPLDGERVALGFIDGMHLAEYALRDFINVERHSEWTGAIVFDDILPRDTREAARDRETRLWTGDVFKLAQILDRHRPDLIRLHVATEPTGLLLVLGLDPSSEVLERRYDELVREIVVPDPQDVPAEVLERRCTLEPEAVLAASVWKTLRRLRARGRSRERGIGRLQRAVRRDLRRISRRAG